MLCLGTHWTYCELHFSQNSINYLNFINPYFKWRATMFLGIFWNQHQSRTSIHETLESPIASFLPVYNSVTLVKCCWYFCGSIGERLKVKLLGNLPRFLLGWTWPSLHSRGSGSANWLMSGKWFRGWNSLCHDTIKSPCLCWALLVRPL